MKKRDLAIILGIYLLAYVIGFFACRSIGETILKFFIFDVVATVMEKRQLARRPEYDEYRHETSRFLLLPVKK